MTSDGMTPDGMISDGATRQRLLRLLTVASLAVACLRLVMLVTSPPPYGQMISQDLYTRVEELRLLAEGHYPRADILLAEGVTSTANTVYPPNAFPFLWLLSPFGDFRLDQLWHGAWSLAALAIVLRFAWSVGAPFSRDAALAAASGVLAFTATFATFKSGQYGLILLALMLGATLALYRGRSGLSGILFGIALLKPTNIAMMPALYLHERRAAPLVAAGLVVAASTLAVALWSGHEPLALFVATYPGGGMRFTAEGYSLVTLVSAAGVPPRLASLLAAIAGFAGLLFALRFVDGRRDPLLVLALTGLATRLGFYHRAYDDVLLIFLALACLRLWIARPTPWSALAALSVFVTLNIPGRLLAAPPLGAAVLIFAVWMAAAVFVTADAARSGAAEQPC